MLCSWEGNRRSGVALAMHHRLTGLSTHGLNGLEKEKKHPICAQEGAMELLYLLVIYQ